MPFGQSESHNRDEHFKTGIIFFLNVSKGFYESRTHLGLLFEHLEWYMSKKRQIVFGMHYIGLWNPNLF